MENYDNLSETFNKLNEFSFIRLLEKPKIINQNLVIGYDGDFPFIIKNGQVIILEEKLNRFVNTNLDSFLEFIMLYQNYMKNIHQSELIGSYWLMWLGLMAGYIEIAEKIDEPAFSSESNYWVIALLEKFKENVPISKT